MTAPEATLSLRRSRLRPIILVAVAVGGIMGGLARWLLSVWLAPTEFLRDFPAHVPVGLTPDAWVTMGINILGAFMLGLHLRFSQRPDSTWKPWWTAGVGAGFLSTFTTLSALAVAWTVGTSAYVHLSESTVTPEIEIAIAGSLGALILGISCVVGTASAALGYQLFRGQQTT